jgi:uncharacterized protein YprB with RNaseH-like and TPR domain
MKAAVLDIETTGLDAIGSGALLCAVLKPLDGRFITLRADDLHCIPGSERRLVVAVNELINQYDLIIGHCIERFDLAWLRSRSVFFGVPEANRPFIYDTFKAFRRLGYKSVPNGFGRPSASLKHVVDFFGIEQDKTAILPREWWGAIWRKADERKKALDNIVSHCLADVRMTERVYWVLMRADHAASIRRFR